MRYYSPWSGNEKGTKEDPTRCVVEVPDGGRSCLFHQCRKPRSNGNDGLLCKIHAKHQAEGKYLSIPTDSIDAESIKHD